jgi:hypothetical protein
MRSLAVLFLVVATGTANAHFILMAPAAYSVQDSFGLPEKSAPCGQDDPGTPIVATPDETTFAEGSTVAITINEAIYHPGHYRVSVAQNEAALPDDPLVTVGDTACGSAVIETTPTLPVVADNLLVHTATFTAPQTVQVTLPMGLTCAHCLLQVVEFMSDHPLNNPGGCFYHHCARVSITGGGVDAPPAAPDVTPVAAPNGGCCDVRGGRPDLLLVGFVALALARRRRLVR